MAYENIPLELKQLNRWVCVRNGSKVPMQSARNKAASSADSATWSSYEEAEAAVLSKRYDNLGFVFTGDGYIGIDIDAGFSENGFLSDLSIDAMRACQSYTEKSRSGRGVHIIVKGSLPFKGKNNRSGMEIYREGRYFIMTGRKLVYAEIAENQEAIDYIVGKYFPEEARESENGGGRARIYKPIYQKLGNGKIPVRPYYPPIGHGGRNISLTSLAGQLHSQGLDPNEIYSELLFANRVACDPPLPEWEVANIVNSVTRYRR